MANINPPTIARPGTGTLKTAAVGFVFTGGPYATKARGGVIDGSESRDAGNTPDTHILRAGTIMAQNATTGHYAPWAIGVSTASIAGAGTTLTVSAATATELVRRIGTSGTFVLTGVNRANSTVTTVRQVTVTYSNVNTTTGAITVTAIGNVNQVDHIRFNAPSTGGNLQLTIEKTDGTFATTGNAAWNATDATYLASINSALDTATGVVGGIVASAVSGVDPDHAIQLTYSGTGYAGLSWTPARVAVFPTGSTTAFVTTPQPAAGTFIAGSVLSKAGWTLPDTLIGEQHGFQVLTDGSDSDWSLIPIAGEVVTSKMLPAVTDTALVSWVKGQMNTNNVFIFN
jgi:hypothetical protein